MPKEKIITECYGTKKTWTSRKKAMNEFLEAMTNSEGSEQQRYVNIYTQLASGMTYCTDKD